MPGAVRLDEAIAFVRAKGDAGDVAALKILLGESLTDAELAALTAPQNPDGGFRVPQLHTELSVVGRTAETLTYLAALGAGDFGAAQAAADFLIERQAPEGTWCELEALRAASPPPHFEPGSPDVKAWETAAALVALNGMGLPLDYRGALEWLRAHRVAAPKRMFRLESILLLAAFHKLEGPDAPSTRRLRAEVEEAAKGGLEVFELNWGIFALHHSGWQASEAPLPSWGEALARHQKEDGGFGSGPQSNAYETVLALCALEHAGAAALPRGPAAAASEPDPAMSDHGI